jgi:ankyrin repeat protein
MTRSSFAGITPVLILISFCAWAASASAHRPKAFCSTLKSDLANMAIAQEEYFREHGVYVNDLRRLKKFKKAMSCGDHTFWTPLPITVQSCVSSSIKLILVDQDYFVATGSHSKCGEGIWAWNSAAGGLSILFPYGASDELILRKEIGSALAGLAAGTSALRIQSLLEKGADADTRDYDGRTALMNAAERGNANVVRHLLACGAGPNLRDKMGKTALTLSREETAWSHTTQPGRAETVVLLLKAGAKE